MPGRTGALHLGGGLEASPAVLARLVVIVVAPVPLLSGLGLGGVLRPLRAQARRHRARARSDLQSRQRC